MFEKANQRQQKLFRCIKIILLLSLLKLKFKIMKKQIIPALVLGLAISFASCGNKTGEDAKSPKSDSTAIAKDSATVETKATNDPFAPFPKETISIEAGGYAFIAPDILNPGIASKPVEEMRLIFVGSKIESTAGEFTKVNYIGLNGDIPNYLVIPVAPGQTAKKGDIVLAPWHHGGSMMRAIVLDDKDPSKPKVNFIDVDWENPAKGDNGVGYGQEETVLEPNTFVVLSNAMSSGTTIAVKEGNDWKERVVVKSAGDKVMIFDSMYKIYVVNKADCKAIEVKPTCKAGDEVMAPWVGTFKKTKVIKVDNKYGRVYVKDPFGDKPLIVPFGTVTSTL